jgi:hypothetical protein
MGFGSDPFGAAPFGLDVPTTTAQRVALAPKGLAFDGLTLDFSPLDSSGRFIEAHPIDTKVFHRLRIQSLTMRSAPGTGNQVRSIKYINPATIEAEIRDAVRFTLEDMVAAGEIEDRGLELDLSVRGRVNYEYRYFNKISGRPKSFRST